MKVLVIGGTMFIGRGLVQELVKAGCDVTVMHRKEKHDLAKKVKNLAADRNDPEAVREAVRGRNFEVVFDNVYDWQRGTTAQQVEATVRACESPKLARYVFLSAVSAYGDGLNHYEGDPLAPDNHVNPYVRNKAMTERLLFRACAARGVPIVTFRPPFVYGPENPFYREAFFWDRLRLNRPIIIPGDGHRLMQFVYVKDLIKAMVACLEKPSAVGEAFNIGNSRAVTQAELVRILAKIAGKKPVLARVPRERIADAGGNAMGDPMYFGEYLDVPPITENVTKVTRVLGVRPTPFETGLMETYRWYLRNGKRQDLPLGFEDRLLQVAANRAAV